LNEALEDLQLITSSIPGDLRLVLEYPSIELSMMELFRRVGG
jgi:hypothetical protein